MRGHRVVICIALLAVCGWCGWVSGEHRRSGAAETTWLVTLCAVLLFDLALWRGRSGGHRGLHLQPANEPWPRRGRGGNGPAFRGVAPWLALAAAALAWDVLGIDSGPHQYHLTISALAQAYRPLNAALLLVWILVGVGYEAARVRAPIDDAGAAYDGGDPQGPEYRGTFVAAMGPLGIERGTSALLLPQSPPVGIVFWVAIPVVAVLIDAAARRSDGRAATAEEFVRFISTSGLVNLALIAAWALAAFTSLPADVPDRDAARATDLCTRADHPITITSGRGH
jgi:hypothetical protein